ncbi:MAG: hypothetical protein NC241_06840 [Bacteroides sp.]|nr:hypothetical protein [Bacteroides sp.]MCM1457512.1 hypothetical protein [Lachnoclostridium sp.]
MNKIQLYITKSTRTFKSMVNINPEEDVRASVTDVRTYLEKVDYDAAEKNIFYLLKSTASGTFVTVLRTIPTDLGDHLAAWIFFPSTLDISAEDAVEIVKYTTKKVAAQGLNADDLAELRGIFSKEYTPVDDAPAIVPCRSADDEFAVRFYGDNAGTSLAELVSSRYQLAYTPFSAVILIDDSLGITSAAPDLTHEPIENMVTVFPPDANADGFAPTIFGEPFTRPFYAPEGADIDIVWTKNGFDDITEGFKVEKAGDRPGPVATSTSKKAISAASFEITALATRQSLDGQCSITVNGCEINGTRYFTLPELASAMVTVACDGFYTYSARIDLASSTRALIQLRERHKVYNFEISAKSSDIAGMISFQINTKNPLTESPIDGYVVADEMQEGTTRTNHLVYHPDLGHRPLIERAIYAAGGLIVGLLLGWLIFGGKGSSDTVETGVVADSTAVTETVENTATPAGPQPAATATQQPAATSLDDAVRYLDTNRTWTRTEMEQFPDLRGLYNDMNVIDRHKIVETWGPKLKESRTFQSIVEHAKMSYRKKARIKGNRNTFNAPDDEKIAVQSYLNTIDP